MTLLENLCKANGQTGGTIHQFVNVGDPNYRDMERAHSDFVRMGIEFSSRASLNKLAAQYHMKIIWVDTAPVDVAWVDDNDGRGPVKLSNSVRCF